MSKRRATTLVELMVSLSAGSSLMLVAIGLVHQTLTISREVSQQSDQDRALARLGALFRQDVHRASEASAESEVELRLSWDDDSEVTYRFADHQITRQHRLASGEVKNESFVFDDKHSATFDSSSEPNRAELLIRRNAGLHNVAPRVELHALAIVNKMQWAEWGGEEAGP